MRRLIGLGLVCCAVLLSNSGTPIFTKREKAFYAATQVVNFVRPGLSVKINSASIAQDGTITAQISVKDPQGLPLDVAGINTPGKISTSFVVAYLPKGQTDYINYITRVQTGAAGTAKQPTSDSTGTLKQTADGQYTYTFKNKAPAGFDASATHTVAVYSSRDLTAFDMGINYVNDTFNFVPNGGTVSDVHDTVRTETCNKCHDPLSAHGGVRQQVQLCVMCHNPGGNGTQTVDPDTGNSIDFKVMVHKIHMGSQLPSVQAGKPYQIIGFQQSVSDWSTVNFPADPRNCQMCHEVGAPPQGGTAPPGSMTDLANSKTPPVHGDHWLTNPSRAACGACHDDVNFATGENHVNLPQFDDKQCSGCHIQQGDTGFMDASILGSHVLPQYAPGVPGVVFSLVKVDNGTAGNSPSVTFTVKDKAGNPIDITKMDFLNLVLGGPTSDYASTVSEDVRKASGGSGTYVYTFKSKLPATATGTYTIGIEGYRSITLLPGTKKQTVVRDVGPNQLINFSVDGSTVAPHPVEAQNSNCNACHYQISAHGTIRNNVQYCIMCHNPNATDAAVRPASAGAAQAIDFPVLIHRIHKGDTAEANGQLTPYVVYGFHNSVNDFSDVRFPGDLTNCSKCHVNDSQQLPLPDSRITVQNPRSFIPQMAPTTAACTACHTDKSAVAHASLNTSPTLGEACATCHAPDADFAVDKVHAH